MANLSYWHIGLRSAKPAQAIWVSTYPEVYRTTYIERGLQRTDPAFVLSFARLLPTDWDAIHRLDGSRAVLEAASAHHIPVRGIAVPIRDETTGDSLFNVNLDCHEAEWRQRRNVLAHEFMVVGHVFHVMMRGLVRGAEPLVELPRLSPREVDVMRLAARLFRQAGRLGTRHLAAFRAGSSELGASSAQGAQHRRGCRHRTHPRPADLMSNAFGVIA